MYPSEHVILYNPTVLCIYTMVRAANTLNCNYLIFLQISQLKEKTGPQLLSDVQLLNTQDHLLNPSSAHKSEEADRELPHPAPPSPNKPSNP